MRAPIVLALLVLAFSIGACGERESVDGGAGAAGGGDCLTAEQVNEEVNRIASGIEASSEDVEEKQAQIREVNAQAC